VNFSILTPGRRHAVLAAVLLALLAAGCSSSSNRPKPAELADFKATLSPRTAWTVAVGAARGAPLKPAVLDNAVYAAAGDGSIVRVAPDNGQVAWRISAGTPLTSGVGSDGFVVAVGTPRGEVLAFGADGKPLWRAQVTSDVRSPPLVGRGLVIVRSTDHRVNAFEADSGKRRWTFSRATPPLTLRAPSAMASTGASVWRNTGLSHRGLSSPGVLPQAVVVGDGRGYLHFLRPESGEFAARLRPDSSAIVAPPALWAGSVIILTQDGTLARVDLDR